MNEQSLERLQAWFTADTVELPDQAVACVRDGPVVHVVLNRPAKRNAMSAAMWRDIEQIAQRLGVDPGVRLVVFRGAGTRAFSGGADISEFRTVYADAERAREYNLQVRNAQLAVERLAKPTLAVVHGVCVGGGCGLALSCDLRFVASDARFGITPGRLGAAYSPPDTRRLLALVGPSRAKDILFSGRLLDAGEALSIGMVDRVVQPDALELQAADYARVLLANSSQSLRTAKLIVNALAGIDPQPVEALESAFEASFASDDFREGYAAFCEKRAPRFG